MSKYKTMGDPLDMLGEEASEIIKEIFKAKRFGLEGDPVWLASSFDNKPPRLNIVQEIADLMYVSEMLQQRGVFSKDELAWAFRNKADRMYALFGEQGQLK